MPSKAKKTLEERDRGAKLTGDELEALSLEFEPLLDSELEEIEQLAKTGDGDEALQRLVRLHGFVSGASREWPAPMSGMGARASRWGEIVNAIAKLLGAVEFSITLGVPAGTSATLTFKVA